MASSKIILPGTPLGPADKHTLGAGTHIHNDQLCASISGPVTTSKKEISINRNTLLPEVGMTVLGRITRTNPRQANVSILALGQDNISCKDPFPALIRQQDIRSTEIDKVKVAESFRVGDIVRATVISLGDERSYYLSTARNELGVVMAESEVGNAMYPVSWREFEDPETGAREGRKVAKPV